MNATVDLAPLISEALLPLLSAVLITVATWAVQRVAAYARWQVTEGQRQLVATAIANGIAYADRRLAGHVGIGTDERVAEALNYVLPKIPDTLKSLGVTPAALSQIIAAKLPG